MNLVKIIPPIYFYMCMALTVVLHFAFPVVTVLEFPWRLLGILPFVAGAVIDILADRSFKQRGTSVKPLGKTTTLITSGTFRLSRHPMYLGMVLVLLGLAMLLGSLTPLLLTLGFAVFLDVVFIRFEEARMEGRFGEDWKRYKARVRRWI